MTTQQSKPMTQRAHDLKSAARTLKAFYDTIHEQEIQTMTEEKWRAVNHALEVVEAEAHLLSQSARTSK